MPAPVRVTVCECGRYFLLEHPGYHYGRPFNASLSDVMHTLQAVGVLKPGYSIPEYPPPVVTPPPPEDQGTGGGAADQGPPAQGPVGASASGEPEEPEGQGEHREGGVSGPSSGREDVDVGPPRAAGSESQPEAGSSGPQLDGVTP